MQQSANKSLSPGATLEWPVEPPTVTIDFDSTLSRRDVQAYARALMAAGVDVWVLTSRYDDLHKHRYPHNPHNRDLWAVVDSLGLPRHKVRFTLMQSKSLYLKDTHVLWHLDDDPVELSDMRKAGCKTVGISVQGSNWQSKCTRFILRQLTEK